MHCCDKSVRKPLLSEHREKGLGKQLTRSRRKSRNNNFTTADTSSVELGTFDNGGLEEEDDVEGGDDVRSNVKMVFGQILLLVWKNLLFRRRHYLVTALEIVLPTLLAMLVAYLRTVVPEGVTIDTTHNTTFPLVSEQASFNVIKVSFYFLNAS